MLDHRRRQPLRRDLLQDAFLIEATKLEIRRNTHHFLHEAMIEIRHAQFRLSMWHSLELRVPYLDHRFVEEVMSIPANLKLRGLNQKRILKRVAAKWLPAPVINHRKQGFEVPMGRWLRGPLQALMQ